MTDVTIRVIVVDDHAVVREGIRTVLDQAEGVTVVGEAATGEEAIIAGGERIPTVRAARGLTTAELSSRIEDDLRSGNYVNDPHVAVNIEEAGSLAFTVDGQVNDPGDFTATPGLTLMRAVAQAKGVNEFARLNDVVVFRTVKGQSAVCVCAE